MPTQKAMDMEQGNLLEALKFLTPREIALIDKLLTAVGEFGEVRLEVKKLELTRLRGHLYA